MSMQPPLGGVAPPLQCNRELGGDFANPQHCGRPGEWHIMWTADGENGIACQEHADEARRLWVFFGMHRYTEVCSMPGACYSPERDECYIDEEGLGLPTLAETLVMAGEGGDA